MYGLDPDTLRRIQDAFTTLPIIDKVTLYGSRAKGNYRNGSDIDITLIGKNLTLENSVYPLTDLLDDLYLAYSFDISIFSHIDNPELVKHVFRVGKTLYRREQRLAEGWKIKKLGETCHLIGGGTPKSGTAEFWGSDIKWITPKDMGKMTEVYVDDTSRKISHLGLEKSSAKLIPEHSVILSTRAPIGHLAINTVPMATNQGCRGLVPSNSLDTKYLFYFLLKNIDLLNELGSGTTFRELSKKSLEKIDIPLPPTHEQKHIVAILDQAFADIEQARTKTKQNLKNARELFESYLQQVFSQGGEGWVEKPIKEVVDSVLTGPFGSMLHKSDYVSYGVPLVNPINIIGDEIIPNDSKTITDETAEKLSSYILSANDLVIGRRGEIGRCAVVSDEQDGWVCGTGCFYIKPSGQLNSYYLAHLLRSPKYRDSLERISTGATMKNLSNSSLKNFVVCFPSDIRKQEDALEAIDDMRIRLKNMEDIYSNKLLALDELKKSILQKAFTGELTNTENKGAAV